MSAAVIMRRAACGVAMYADIDPITVYRDGRRMTAEETYHRHVWLWIARTRFDLVEADMARALGVDHDTIASACHKIEDDIDADPALEAALDEYGARMLALMAAGDELRTRIDRALARRRRAA